MGSAPAVINVSVITPIVFCASFVPCASDTSEAEVTGHRAPVRFADVRAGDRADRGRASPDQLTAATSAQSLPVTRYGHIATVTVHERRCLWCGVSLPTPPRARGSRTPLARSGAGHHRPCHAGCGDHSAVRVPVGDRGSCSPMPNTSPASVRPAVALAARWNAPSRSACSPSVWAAPGHRERPLTMSFADAGHGSRADRARRHASTRPAGWPPPRVPPCSVTRMDTVFGACNVRLRSTVFAFYNGHLWWVCEPHS